MKSENGYATATQKQIIRGEYFDTLNVPLHQQRVDIEARRGPAGRTTQHGVKRSMLFPSSRPFGAGSPDVAWDVFRKIQPAFVSIIPMPEHNPAVQTKPDTPYKPIQNIQRSVPKISSLQWLATTELQFRGFESLYSGDLEDARNCYLLLTAREPEQTIYQRVLNTVVEKIRARGSTLSKTLLQG